MAGIKLFVPGRICLFGEHSDWAGGYRRVNVEIPKGHTVITGTNQGIRAEVEPHPSQLVMTSALPDGTTRGPCDVAMEKEALLAEAASGGFFSYMAGVAYQILTHYHVKGLAIHCQEMDLPIKKGLSSSAAACVLTARAFNQVYDLKLTTRGEMEAAYQGELLTPSRCGRMDQGCAFGQRPLSMTYDGDLLQVEEIPVKRPVCLLIVDLCAGKDTMEILAKLNQCYPFPQTELHENVHRYLGEINQRLVGEALEVLREGDARRLGELMTEAQRLFDAHLAPACPSQLTAPVLHRVLEHESLQPLIWGGKGVGSQGDGTAQLVCRDAAARERAARIIETELSMQCLRLDIAPPASVRKAVIPVAGFGTRLYPASKAAKKELFPIVDRDGVAKPVIQLIVEEALSAGMEEVCLIVQAEDEATFDAFFNLKIPVQNFNRLPTHLRDYADHVAELGRRVRFVVQDRQEGFGHAVLCAREWVGEEPFLLLLGDHLYRSDGDVSCAQQLLAAYERRQQSTVALMTTPEEAVGSFGTVAGDWIDYDSTLNITEFAEKPAVEYARERLQIDRVEEGHYLTVFGQYVLKPEVFEILQDYVDRNLRQGGEFQLTSALEEMRGRQGFIGTRIAGRRFDIGTPQAYVQTVVDYARD